ASRIAEYVGRAFRVATSGRPGPVALALPEDMLRQLVEAQKSIPYTAAKAHPSVHDVSKVKSILETAERPLLMLGGSGWTNEAVKQIQSFAENNNLPVTVSFRCQDRFNNNHDNYIGDMGIGANPALVKRMQDADVLMVLGSRLGEMTTNGYERISAPVPEQTLIHIHQGAEELGHVYQPDLAINATPATIAPALSEMKLSGSERWTAGTKAARAAFEAWTVPTDNPGPVKVAALYEHMRSALPADTIICNGAGNYAAWLHRFYRYETFPSQLAPTSGAMGYGVPAAIAAKITNPERPVVAFAGDGCFMMNATDLATAAHYNANVVFLVFNNSMYGTIRMHQERDYPVRVSGTELTNPDFVAFARSFGLHADKVEATEDFAPALDAAMNAGKPALIEITIDPDAIAPTATISGLRGK
ncbi:MAG: thiamine pyrophosphate-dependent enzyme, partial [Kordiimonas sp.]